MPANVNYEYVAAKAKYDAASTDEEKVVALQQMLSTAPTHKGAENLRKDLSRKLAALKNKMEKNAANAKKSGHTINIRKEGAGQVIVLGYANSGKSTFLKSITNATPEIAMYPFTTTRPEMGTLNYGGALIQVIELPSFLQNHELTPQIYSMVRVADILILTIRDGSVNELNGLIKTLEKEDIFITKNKPDIRITRSGFSDLSFVNEQNLKVDKNKATDLLKSSGFNSCSFILNQKTTIEDLLLLVNPRAAFVPCICVSIPFTKHTDAFVHKKIPVIDASKKEDITDHIFKLLDKIIVYTKKPGEKDVDKKEPLVMPTGSKVIDAAKEIHKSFYKQIKSARVWGSTKYPGQTVSKKYVLKNKDVVEFVN